MSHSSLSSFQLCSLLVTKIQTSSSSPSFSLNLRTNQKFNQDDNTNALDTVCRHADPGPKKTLFDDVAAWLKSMGDMASDPFWMLDPSVEPLDLDDPKVDVYLKHYEGRQKFRPHRLHVVSSDRELFNGVFIDGRLKVGQVLELTPYFDSFSLACHES